MFKTIKLMEQSFKTRKLDHFVFKNNRPAKPDKSKISVDRHFGGPTDMMTYRSSYPELKNKRKEMEKEITFLVLAGAE